MNLVKFENVYDKIQDGWYYMHQWREIDHKKIDNILEDMFSKIKKIDDRYIYQIDKKSNISPYLGDFITYQNEYFIYQEYKDFSRKFNFFVPKIVNHNYYILNNALYVPILMLEKSPIDRVLIKTPTKNENKIYANLNPIYNFTFDFNYKVSKNEIIKVVYFKFKKIELDLFLRIIFDGDDEALEFLLEKGYIFKKDHSISEKRKFIKFLGFHKEAYFDEINMAEWIDEFLILEYFHDIFEDYYGIRSIKDIILKIINLHMSDEDIDMSDISNRRLVHIEYLIKPLFESYLRLLYGAIDKNGQNFLITTNPKVILTTGFTKNLHRGNLYDISLPFASPLINKISQDITVISDGRLPKSWQHCHKNAYGIACPISVSAQNTATNLVLTTNTLINEYGRIRLKSEKEI